MKGLVALKLKLTEDYKMNVQDLNIEGLTEKEFQTKVTRMMDKVYDFAMRGREELGYDIAYISILGTHEKENDGVIASDMSFGSNDMLLSLAMQTNTLEKVVELSNDQKISDLFTNLFDEEDEEDE